MLLLAPGAPRELADGRDLTLVSGTNGKTTTTAFLAACLRLLGPVDVNDDGANTRAGFVRTLASGNAARVVLETDEGWMPWAVEQVRPSTVALLNLSRDQLHRHAEVSQVARAWSRAMHDVPHVIANADDPAVVLAALAAPRQTWVSAGARWTEDAAVCPRCTGLCRHAGSDWWCESCGLRRPGPSWWLEGTVLVGPGTRLPLDLALPGAANLANAAIAVATAAERGVDPAAAVQALRGIRAVAGRYDVFTTPTHQARLILAKNPASWQEALATVRQSPDPLVVAFNSEGVDGRDPSWLYDIPFRELAGRRIVVTGRRATDMLVRLELDGFTDVGRAHDVAAAIAMLPAGGVQVVANYTAFQEARQVLGRAR